MDFQTTSKATFDLGCSVGKEYYKYKRSSLKKVVSHIDSNRFSWPLIGQTIAFKASSHIQNWFLITNAVFWTSLLAILFAFPGTIHVLKFRISKFQLLLNSSFMYFVSIESSICNWRSSRINLQDYTTRQAYFRHNSKYQ